MKRHGVPIQPACQMHITLQKYKKLPLENGSAE